MEHDMAKIISQFTSFLKAGVEGLLQPAEDPRKTFVDPQQHQRDLLARMQEALAQNSALRKRLENRITQLQAKVPQLEEVAKQAVNNGRDDTARLALQQRQLAIIELKSLEASKQEVQLEEQRISIIEQRLTAQIEAMRVRQQMTAVRYTAAESQVMANEAISGVSKELNDLGQSIEQTEQKTEHMQARASAMEQFSDFAALDLSGDPGARELIQLDIEKAVEQQLAELKRLP
jgi:phage shock protein A